MGSGNGGDFQGKRGWLRGREKGFREERKGAWECEGEECSLTLSAFIN